MKCLVHADVNLNLIDGSSIWVQSLIEVLRGVYPQGRIVLLSRETMNGQGVSATLQKTPDLDIRTCDQTALQQARAEGRGTAAAVAQDIVALHARTGFDRIIVRGTDIAAELAADTAVAPRLWAYLLHTPSLDDGDEVLTHIVRNAGGLLVQTDAQRSLLEALIPEASNKTSVLPPMVSPVHPTAAASAAVARRGVRFIYSGKYSHAWNVEAFFDIPARCDAAGVASSLTLIGDKVHQERDDPGFRNRILQKFRETAHVTWLGAMERDDAIAVAGAHDLGLCWRTDALNDSLEISTKFLEFASQGVPAVVNRTAAYEQLLGPEYPYFANTMADVVAAASRVAADPAEHARIRDQVRLLAADYSYDTAGQRLRHALRMPVVRPALGSRPKVLVASHDLKFLSLALEWLRDEDRYDFLFDRWTSSVKHDEQVSQTLLEQADVIFSEWCNGQAAWYSRRKRSGQRMFIRLHRFEAFTPEPHKVCIDNVDGIIVVSPFFRDYCHRTFGWPLEKIVVIPQYCVAEQFRRPKYDGAAHTLGLVGINDSRKRPHVALDVLRHLREADPRFRLRIRSVMPWDISWLWSKPAQASYYRDLFNRVRDDPLLADAVLFDRPGPNMAEWFRNIGYLLSTSESEGCHTAVSEALCSGSRAAIMNWDGADGLYPDYVGTGAADLANRILVMDKAGLSRAQADDIMDRAAQSFDIARLLDQLRRWFG